MPMSSSSSPSHLLFFFFLACSGHGRPGGWRRSFAPHYTQPHPLSPFSKRHLPPMLPCAVVHVQELEPVVEVSDGDVHVCLAIDTCHHSDYDSLHCLQVATEGRTTSEASAGWLGDNAAG